MEIGGGSLARGGLAVVERETLQGLERAGVSSGPFLSVAFHSHEECRSSVVWQRSAVQCRSHQRSSVGIIHGY